MLEDDVKFRITVKAVREDGGLCYAGHKAGDSFECGYLTPQGLCGWAYHSIYPFLHAFRHTKVYENDDYRIVKNNTLEVTCSDNGWVTFHIEKLDK